MIATPVAREALEALERGHCPVPLRPDTKVPPPGFDLSGWLAQSPTEADVLRAFRDPCNLGLALGLPSGGLAVRDYDDPDAFHRWAARNPQLARAAMIAETARGFHVGFTATAFEIAFYARSGGSIAVFPDGELRHGGYVVAPPSRHPTGKSYRWVNRPDDAPFVHDLLDARLAPADALRSGDATQEINTLAGPAWGALTVGEAIHSAMPTGPGQRHRRLFGLVRMLRSIEGTRDADPPSLLPIVRRWHSLASPMIRTKAFDETRRDFLDAWHRVRVPVGSTMRAVSAEAGGEGFDRLGSLCGVLQSRVGDRPFFLDVRTAGEVCGVHYATASRWLRRLCRDGSLVVVKPGDHRTHRATEYRWCGSAAKADRGEVRPIGRGPPPG